MSRFGFSLSLILGVMCVAIGFADRHVWALAVGVVLLGQCGYDLKSE